LVNTLAASPFGVVCQRHGKAMGFPASEVILAGNLKLLGGQQMLETSENSQPMMNWRCMPRTNATYSGLQLWPGSRTLRVAAVSSAICNSPPLLKQTKILSSSTP
jgi:hypothetical protein